MHHRPRYRIFLGLPPADPAWQSMDFVNEGDPFKVPALWVFSWYDIAIAPNLHFFSYLQNKAPGQ